MICYRDMTFCTFYKSCKDGESCERALTPKIKKEAEECWEGTLRFVCLVRNQNAGRKRYEDT